MIVKNVRISYAQTFEPKDSFNDGRLAYSATFLIGKNDQETISLLNEAIEKATAAGVANGKFTASQAKGSRFKTPLRDGDSERAENPDARGPEYDQCMFFNARSSNPIGNVDRKLSPIDPKRSEDFYSGWYVHADVNFYPFNSNGSVGVAAGLNNVMWIRAGERLDGRQNAVDAFAGLQVDDDEGGEDFE